MLRIISLLAFATFAVLFSETIYYYGETMDSLADHQKLLTMLVNEEKLIEKVDPDSQKALRVLKGKIDADMLHLGDYRQHSKTYLWLTVVALAIAVVCDFAYRKFEQNK